MLTKEQFKLAFDRNMVVYDNNNTDGLITMRLLSLIRLTARRNNLGQTIQIHISKNEIDSYNYDAYLFMDLCNIIMIENNSSFNEWYKELQGFLYEYENIGVAETNLGELLLFKY